MTKPFCIQSVVIGCHSCHVIAVVVRRSGRSFV